METLFLQALFQEVKNKINPHLGIADYLDLLDAVVQKGIGLENIKELESLCALLLLKSKQEQEAFRALLKNFIDEKAKTLETTRKIATPDNTQKPDSKTVEDNIESPKTNEETKISRPQTTDNQTNTNSETTSDENEMTTGNVAMSWKFDDLVKNATLENNGDWQFSGRFFMNKSYHPFAQRKSQQYWRQLRQLKSNSSTDSDNLNVAATVNRIAQKGFFEQPVFHKNYVNEYNLTVLVDRKGSMLAFHSLADFMVETIKKEIPNANIYYFRNQPQEYFYGSPDWTQAITKEDLVKKINKNNANVLIISDSGAARGSYVTARLQAWWRFFNSIKGNMSQSAWFNPMPQTRWANTTAIYVAKLIPMLEISEDESSIKKIIQSLKRMEVMR
jgi:uncharacterized protein